MRRALPLFLWSLAACGPQTAEVNSDDGSLAVEEAPLLGAGAQDQAERGCHVVLRRADRAGTSCTSTGCWWVFEGTLDVSAQAVAEGARPFVLVKNIDASTWTRVAATATAGAPAGFQRYAFRAARNTVRDGMSATAYTRAHVQLAPYLRTASGARLFDHNRNPGDFDNYVLDAASGWSVPLDEATCAPPPAVKPTVSFSAAWQTAQRGLLVAGRPFAVEYALERLPQCRGTHNGYPAWDVVAHARFSPSGQEASGSVRGFSSPTGTPSNSNAVAVPWTADVPAGTTRVELWFENFTGAGSGCAAWDSNYGAHYAFDVEPRAPQAVGWVGNPGSSFTRACSRQDGVPDEVRLDSYLYSRACTFVEVDVWVPGLTDGAALKPHGVLAQAELVLDGRALPPAWLTFVGRVGNDYRYRFELPRSELYYGPKWTTLRYGLRFSTDGDRWTAERARTVVRDASFCNPAWVDCAP